MQRTVKSAVRTFWPVLSPGRPVEVQLPLPLRPQPPFRSSLSLEMVFPMEMSLVRMEGVQNRMMRVPVATTAVTMRVLKLRLR